ncbi:hypothetical protein LSCM1_05599 [Leishmania martiniquensis]|uniref:Uncharacterized protein n=1 Tax=Leishmania martiniquensis TaxID=1580590 RepID=A0A836HCF0_9TRYP|nr:hypothetical protein LSCM1_05599 [Leishmania martiniquensis]
MPSLRAHPDTQALVVVVDAFDPLAQDTISLRAKAYALERFEMDVDVVPDSTTVDMLLADVAAALQEMKLAMCVPLQSAALASGSVLPPLALIQHAMGANGSSGAEGRHGSLILSLQDSYAAAVQYTLSHRGTRQLATAAPPPPPLRTLRIGSDYAVEGESGHLLPSTVTWSVVPQLMAAAGSIASREAALPASSITSPLCEPMQNFASAGATAEAGGTAHMPLVALPPLPRDGAPTATTASSHASSGDRLPDSEATTASFPVNSATADVSQNECSPKPSFTADSTALPLSRLPLFPRRPPSAPVVALEEVNVAAFRRLQACQERPFTCGAQRRDSSRHTSDFAAAPAVEQRQLQPTLSWAAVEAAVQTEVEGLPGEQGLVGEQMEVEAAVATGMDSGESLSEAAGGDLQSGAGRGSLGGGVTSGRSSQPQLRAQRLAAVREKTCAYRRKAAALRRATEKARQWRESVKKELREEIEALEAEEAQRSAALVERDVLRRRVVQLEAQVAAAKAAEMALLATRESAAVLPPASAKEQRASSDLRAAGGFADAQQPCVTAAVAKPALWPLSDTSASRHGGSFEHSPPLPLPLPLPQACRSAPPESGDYVNGSASAHRWSGRRVPLTAQDSTAATRPKRIALAQPEGRQRPSRSQCGLAAERSFLSPAIQAELRAALASDEEADLSMTDSHSETAGSAEAGDSHASNFDEAAEAELLPPSVRMRRRRPRATASRIAADASPELCTASPMTASAEAPSAAAIEAAVLRTAVTAASSLHTAAPYTTSPFSNQQVQESSPSSFSSTRGGSRSGDTCQAALASAAPAGAAVEELRRVAAALRRHIRDASPDPLEGQRLLERVRTLRQEIERESERSTCRGTSPRPQPKGGAARMVPAVSESGRSTTAGNGGLTDMRFASAALGHGDVTSLSADMSSGHGGSLHGPSGSGSPSRRWLHSQLSPSHCATSQSWEGR